MKLVIKKFFSLSITPLFVTSKCFHIILYLKKHTLNDRVKLEICCESVRWIQLAHYIFPWRAIVNTVMNFLVA